MKKHLLPIGVFLAVAAGSSVFAQVAAPPGAGDKNLEDRNIKTRSIDLERIDRDAQRSEAGTQSQAAPAANFAEIKQDFENIQRLQDQIVAAYKVTVKVDYATISASAEQMSKSAARLESNLFPAADKPKKKKRSKDQAAEAPPAASDMKSLIVDLDNTIAAFVRNAMFTNPQVINAAENARARSDLRKIINLSSALKQEADKPVE